MGLTCPSAHVHICCSCVVWPFFKKNIYLFVKTIFSHFTYISHSHFSRSPHLPPTSPLIHSSERVKSPMGSQNLTHHFESRTKPIFLLSKVSKKQFKRQGKILVPLSGATKTAQATHLPFTFRGPDKQKIKQIKYDFFCCYKRSQSFPYPLISQSLLSLVVYCLDFSEVC